MVACASAVVGFCFMAQRICELLCLKIILIVLRVRIKGLMMLYSDKKAAITISNNLVQHDQTKYVEIDRHFIKEKLGIGQILDMSYLMCLQEALLFCISAFS